MRGTPPGSWSSSPCVSRSSGGNSPTRARSSLELWWARRRGARLVGVETSLRPVRSATSAVSTRVSPAAAGRLTCATLRLTGVERRPSPTRRSRKDARPFRADAQSPSSDTRGIKVTEGSRGGSLWPWKQRIGSQLGSRQSRESGRQVGKSSGVQLVLGRASSRSPRKGPSRQAKVLENLAGDGGHGGKWLGDEVLTQARVGRKEAEEADQVDAGRGNEGGEASPFARCTTGTPLGVYTNRRRGTRPCSRSRQRGKSRAPALRTRGRR